MKILQYSDSDGRFRRLRVGLNNYASAYIIYYYVYDFSTIKKSVFMRNDSLESNKQEIIIDSHFVELVIALPIIFAVR